MSLLRKMLSFSLKKPEKTIFYGGRGSDIPHHLSAMLCYQRLLHRALRKRRHRPVPFLIIDTKASFTVEASVVLPIVIFICVFVLMFFRILSVQWGVGTALQEVARRASVYGDVLSGSEGDGVGILSTGVMVATAESEIISKNVPVKFITNGQLGINLFTSKVDERDIDLVATYRIKMPMDIFGNQSMFFKQRARVRRWTGYDPHEEGEEEGEKVYVTATGTAYHRRLNCTYLNPSVSPVAPSNLGSKRNESGGKYYPCERCMKISANVYYITTYGDVYHTSLTCSSLKRSISKVLLEEAIKSGHHACSKCG